MNRSGTLTVLVFTFLTTLSGCNATRPGAVIHAAEQDRLQSFNREVAQRGAPASIIRASLGSPTDATTISLAQHLEPGKRGSETLTVDALVADVLARNPSLAQMTAAWQAASARYPQVRSWDDPMVSGMLAPSSFGSNAVESGYRFEVSQKIPFPGKLRLRGQGALAEASAAESDVEDLRVQLVETTKLAFYDYYLVERAIAVNKEGLDLLKQFRENADLRFKTGQVPQQDVLQAVVEIGRQQERGVTLERMRKVAIARINTLRSAVPDESIGAPPEKLATGAGLPTIESLRSIALTQRPDLKALEDRITAEKTAIALAFKDYYPDVEIAGIYDSIMGNGPARDLAPQVGVRMNLPIRLSKRNAAVAEAQAKVAQKQAELSSRVNQVQFQVQEAYEQVIESEQILALYEKTLLPAARDNVKAAQAAYTTGKTPFLSLIEAQRSLIQLRDRNYLTSADYHRRLASLERAIGGPIAVREESERPVHKK